MKLRVVLTCGAVVIAAVVGLWVIGLIQPWDQIADVQSSVVFISNDGKFTIDQYVFRNSMNRGQAVAYLRGVGPLIPESMRKLKQFIDERGCCEYLSASLCDDGTWDIIYWDWKTRKIQNLSDEFRLILN